MRLFAFDGTAVSLAHDSTSETHQKSSDPSVKGANYFRVTAMRDVTNHTYSDVVIQTVKEQSEIGAAKEMISRMKAFKEPVVILCDGAYGSLDFIENVRRKGMDIVVSWKQNQIKEIKDLPQAEWDIDLTIPIVTEQNTENNRLYREGKVKLMRAPRFEGDQMAQWTHGAPYLMKIRVLRFQSSKGVWKTLATTLTRMRFSTKEIRALYRERWEIETSFRHYKYSAGLSRLHSKGGDLALQEIWAGILVSNAAHRIANAARLIYGAKWNEEEKKANISNAFQVLRKALKDGIWEDIEKKAARYPVAIRPGRSAPRPKDRDRKKNKFKKGHKGYLYRVP